ncbi:hypothetical protein BC835DRAFT_1408164 [Cytidiella melzeri]|nr:hypothetical protein BC835DRAFT_1408164 [Cytidiella melzeri]
MSLPRARTRGTPSRIPVALYPSLSASLSYAGSITSATSHERVDQEASFEGPRTPPPRQQSGLRSLPSCIPAHANLSSDPHASSPPRTLVLCFDGTGDQFDTDNSNVVQFFSMLKKDDRRQQMVYYQAGIGTYTTQRFAIPSMGKVSKILDEMIAWNLDAHVKDGYEFIMQNYEAGDKICIFGFSRGAYTARALAGMIHKVGLLPACNHRQVPFAYKMYINNSRLGWSQSTAFKKAFSMDVDVEFIGVWDTVSSVGFVGKRLPFTASNTCVKYFRHAVSLDERRSKFRANKWNWPSEREKGLGVQAGEMPKAGVDVQSSLTVKQIRHEGMVKEDKKGDRSKKHRKKVKGKSGPDHSPDQDMMEQTFSKLDAKSDQETDVLEVWFVGCHCDVGGGSVPNDTRHNLARIPLRWMIRQCFLANTGIRFYAELLRSIGIEPASLYPVVKTRPPPIYATPSSDVGGNKLNKRTPSEKRTTKKARLAASVLPSSTSDSLGIDTSGSNVQVVVDQSARVLTEEEEDLEDALSPVYDQLQRKKAWWVLEMLPVRHRVQKEDDSWGHELTMNLGKGREIIKHSKHDVYVHRSVKIRMEAHASQVAGAQGRKYAPKAKFGGVEPTWVD